MPTIKSINVAIAHNFILFHKLMDDHLSDYNTIRLVFQTDNLNDFFLKDSSHSIDVLLLDLQLLNTTSNHYSLIKLLRQTYPSMKVLIISNYNEMALVGSILDYGIHGCLSVEDGLPEILEAIQAVHRIGIYRSNLFTEALYYNKINNLKTVEPNSSIILDDREKKIIKLMWEEKSNKQIAGELFLSIRSVEKIRQELKTKLNVKSTIGIIKYSIQEGLLPNIRE